MVEELKGLRLREGSLGGSPILALMLNVYKYQVESQDIHNLVRIPVGEVAVSIC